MPNIILMPVESSNIQSVGYDEESKILAVVFKKNNARYHYSDVPKKTYDEFLSAQSIGKFFYSRIRGIFKYQKIS